MDGRHEGAPGGARPSSEAVGLGESLGPPEIGLFAYDPASDVLTCDEVMLRMLDAPPGAARLPLEAYLARVEAEDRPAVAALLRGGGREDGGCEHRIVRPDGSQRWATARLRAGGEGASAARFGCLVETTAQHGLADRLIQVQKLAGLGQLAGGIAHTFNNLLAAMLPNLEVAQRHAVAGSSAPLEHARDAALRAARLVKQLLILASRHSAVNRSDVDLATLCRRVVETCRAMFDPRITIEIEGPPRLMVRGDIAQLEQAILNLMLNARDALADLEVTHGGERTPWIRVVIDTAAAPGAPGRQVARLQVSDDGEGFGPDVERRLFQPFFTTKAHGEGTGLGLAAALAIARGHDGGLAAESVPGSGARFTLTVPCEEAPAASARAGGRAQAGREATILLAEDEPLVRQVLATMLRDAGHRVIEAIDGIAALELYKEHEGQIDLCVIDQAMPRMSGQALLGILLGIDPKLKAISITGFGVGLKGARAVLDKPIASDVFLSTVSEVLASPE
jgi:two-component system cell cycle sensor histidine kinase/response regulator CckA